MGSETEITTGETWTKEGKRARGSTPYYRSLDECPNGAAKYLYYAGIVTLACSVAGVIMTLFRKYAENDGKLNCLEGCGICLIGTTSGLLILVSVAILLWGSVIVFTAYPDWSHDKTYFYKKYYCHKTPFMTAFVILILNWLLLPFLVVCSCLALLCKFCKKN